MEQFASSAVVQKLTMENEQSMTQKIAGAAWPVSKHRL